MGQKNQIVDNAILEPLSRRPPKAQPERQRGKKQQRGELSFFPYLPKLAPNLPLIQRRQKERDQVSRAGQDY